MSTSTAARPAAVIATSSSSDRSSSSNPDNIGIVFPIIIDVSAIPVKPRSPSPESPFTFPKPKVMTGPRSWVRVVKARGKMVVIDSDLAELYGTTVDIINKAAMRNACCFTRSTCFRLSNDEWHHLKSDAPGGIGLAEADRGNWLCAPLVFTSDGALAVSNILDTFDATRGSVIVWRTIHNLKCGGTAV